MVGIILFMVVGPSKLPGLAKQIGQGLKDLKKGLGDIKGSVDKDDEFVKAVSDARRSVAEAKESLRTLFDPDDEDPYNEDDQEADTYTKQLDRPESKGLRMVKPGGRPPMSTLEEPAATPDQPSAEASPSEEDEEETSETAAEPPVEGEVWKADAAVDRRAQDTGGVPAMQAAPRPSRRMVKPGKSRGHDSTPLKRQDSD